MIFGLKIAMLVIGLIALLTGKAKLTRKTTVRGPAARLGGAIWLLPLPLAFLAGALLAYPGAAGVAFDPKEVGRELALLEGALTVGCLVAGLVVALLGRSTAGNDRPPRRDPAPHRDEGPLDAILVVQPVDPGERGLPAEAFQTGPRSQRPAPLPPGGAPPERAVGRSRGEGRAPSGWAGWAVAGAVGGVLLFALVGGAVLWAVFSPLGNDPAQQASPDRAQPPVNRIKDIEVHLKALEPKDIEEAPRPLPAGATAGTWLPADAGDVLTVGYSRDGKTLAVGTRHERALWYDAGSRRLLARSPGRGPGIDDGQLSGCAISPQADKVAFFKHGGLLYFVERNKAHEEVVLQRTTPGGVAQWKAAFSPDGKFLCTTHGDRVSRIWDVDGRVMLRELPGHQAQVGSTAYSPDGSLLACADTEVFLWDAKGHRLLAKLKGPGRYFLDALAFSADGKMLAGIHDRTVLLWALERNGGKIAAEAREAPDAGRVHAIAFSPDTRLLLTACDDGHARAWDTQTLERRHDLALEGGASTLAFRATDGQLAVGNRNRVLLYDLRALKPE
jgi:hypothetical protein